MKKVLILFFSVLIFFACTSTKVTAPEYISDSRSFFDEAVYLSATGEGSSKTMARENAAVELSRYLNTEISSSIDVKTVLSDVNGKYSLNETVTTQSTSQSQFAFSGLQYTEYFQNKKTFYVTVYIERQKAYDQYNVEARVLKNEFLSLYETAESLDPISSYSYYQKAGETAPALLQKITMLTAISPALTSDEYGDVIKKISLLETKKKTAIAKSYVSIQNIDGDFENIIFSQVESSLRNCGFIIKKGADGMYKVYVALNLNQTVEEDGELFVATPSVEISILYGEKTVYSFNTKVQQKTITRTLQKLQRDSLKKLAAAIKEEFVFN